MAKTSTTHYCCGTGMADFAVSSQSEEHCYCRQCGAHVYKGRRWTKDEWFFYINEMTFKEYQRREQAARDAEIIEDSLHAHELINHSNPEEV